MRRTFSLFCAKTAGKFSLTCLPLQQLFGCTGVQIHSQSKNGGFISSNMHPEIPAFGQQKTPTESGFLRNISFLCSLYGGEGGI